MTDEAAIIALLRLGWSERRVAREKGVHRSAIRRIRDEAGLAPSKRTGAADVPNDPADSKRTNPTEVPTEPAAPRSSAAAFVGFIEAELGKRRNATAIYQDLVEHHGYDGSYDAVKRLARKLRKREPKIACRFETDPGEEMQVDYGEGALTRDPRTGKYRRPRLFVLTLGNSRHAFRKTIWKSSSQAWCELHEEAFAFFGGVARTIRFDNLKEGVIKPDIYDPQLNALYAKMLEHYRVTPLPCRPYSPDLKGKVESAVGYTQATALRGRRFESIEEQNAFLVRWDDRWASTRIHGTMKRQVRAMFAEERSFLLALPATRFEYYRIGVRTVAYDGHIEVDGAYYSAPPRYAGRKVAVYVGRLWLRIVDTSTQECVREHPIALQRGQRRTIDSDRPKQTPVQVETLAQRIGGAGPGCAGFSRALVDDRGALALRALYGVLDLLRRYNAADVDRACAFAISTSSKSLHFVRAYLAHHATATTMRNQHRVIPDAHTYSKHFQAIAEGTLP